MTSSDRQEYARQPHLRDPGRPDTGHAVVVGVGPGLGASLARQYARTGHDVTLVARSPRSTAAVAAEIRAMGQHAHELHADVADLDAVAATIGLASARRPVTLLHHNASMHAGSLLSAEPRTLRDAVAVNALAAVTAVRAALPDLEATAGVVLWTGGGVALTPRSEYGVLALGKAALRTAALALAPELAERGVRLRMLTVKGFITPGGAFDPDRIAEAFWAHALDPDAEVERVFVGRP